MTLPAGMQIRPARPDDAAAHLALWSGVVAEERWLMMDTFPHTVDEYRRLFQQPVSDDGARLAAISGREMAGSIRIERLQGSAHRHVAYFTMAVAAHWRRHGIGAALLAAALDWARAARIERVTLGVYASNASAIALYRKFGFEEEGRLIRQSKKPWGYEDEVLMALVNP